MSLRVLHLVLQTNLTFIHVSDVVLQYNLFSSPSLLDSGSECLHM